MSQYVTLNARENKRKSDMDAGTLATIVGTGLGGVALIYMIVRNFKEDVNKKFESHERRFELLDQRIFLICMGKSLPDILKAEREEKK